MSKVIIEFDGSTELELATACMDVISGRNQQNTVIANVPEAESVEEAPKSKPRAKRKPKAKVKEPETVESEAVEAIDAPVKGDSMFDEPDDDGLGDVDEPSQKAKEPAEKIDHAAVDLAVKAYAAKNGKSAARDVMNKHGIARLDVLPSASQEVLAELLNDVI